jgi:hypothetical protein
MNEAMNHSLQFGIELEMVLRPNDLGLERLAYLDFDNSDEAHADALLCGRRDTNREAVCELLILLLRNSNMPVNKIGDTSTDRWTVENDPTIRD